MLTKERYYQSHFPGRERERNLPSVTHLVSRRACAQLSASASFWEQQTSTPQCLSHCLPRILVFLFPLYCDPFNSRGRALGLARAPGLPCAWHRRGIEQILVKWVLLQQKWPQTGELDGIRSEVLPDPKLLDWVCLHGKVRFFFWGQKSWMPPGTYCYLFLGVEAGECFPTELTPCLSQAFLLVYMYRSIYVCRPRLLLSQ